MARARARIQGGDIVCAATLRQARIPIHAAPLANRTRFSQWKTWMRPAAKVIRAKRTMAAATTPSTDKRVRRRGRTAAAGGAARPKETKNKTDAAGPDRPVQGNRGQRGGKEGAAWAEAADGK